MNIKKYLLLASVGLMAVACQDKKEVEPNTPIAKEGDEVQFGASLDDSPESRTIYGDENSAGFPVFWLYDDEMIVASPQCSRKTGNYGVQSNLFDPNDPWKTSATAGTLERKGEAGVQWGSSNEADFYSIYPQRTKVEAYTVTTTETTDNVIFNINTPEVQTCLVDLPKSGSTNPTMKTADMYSCFMYAKTEGAKKTEEAVNLKYVPFATAIRFKLKAPSNGCVISDIKLTAPTDCPISGKYTVDLSSVSATNKYPTVTAVSGSRNTASMVARYSSNQNYLQISGTQSIELNIFIMLQSGKTYDISSGWELSVVVNGQLQTLSLDGTVVSGSTANLEPGKVYRLPDLPALNDAKWTIEKWMTYIPRNVYLSEISIPGAWCANNPSFQGTASTATQLFIDQFNLGVRAFHFDTQWETNLDSATPENLTTVDQLGMVYNTSTHPLKEVGSTGKYATFANDGWYIKGAINAVYNGLAAHPGEYAVILFTFAQDSYPRTDKTWMQGVQDAVDKWIAEGTGRANRIFDGSTLSPNTTIADVLDKIIIIVNCEDDPTSYSATPITGENLGKLVFTNMPMIRTSANYPGTSGFYNTSNIYSAFTEESKTGMNFINTQAQVTSNESKGFNTSDGKPVFDPTFSTTKWVGKNVGYAPLISQRNAVGNNILTWSSGKTNRETYTHSDLIFLGLGGYLIEQYLSSLIPTEYNWRATSNGYTSLASTLNTWINGKITGMTVQTGYYPVGIVMMNWVNSYKGENQAVQNILFLNNKFHKAFDPNRPAWPTN